MHPDAEPDRYRSRDNLTAELLPPPQAAEVVDRADGGSDGGAEQQSARLAREVEERKRRYENPEEERKPAQARHGATVQATPFRPVDDAEQTRHPADGRRQEDDDRRGEERAPDDLEMVGERMQHQRVATSCRTACRLRRPDRAR